MLAKLLVRLIAPICILLTQPLFAAATDDPLKIGLIVPLTGGQASTGKQLDNAVKLYISENGDMVAGRKIEVIVKDDGAVPDNTKRIAQELIVNDKVDIIAGFGITPAALAAAPLATQARIPHQLHPGTVVGDHRRLGCQERNPEGRDTDHRLRARQ